MPVAVWYLGKMNVLKGGKAISVQDHSIEDSYKFLTGPPPACHRPGSAAAGTDLRSALRQKSRWSTSSQHQIARWKIFLIE